MPTARALYFLGPRRVELRDVAVPDPAEGEVEVATELSGISAGTEMLAWRGEVDPGMRVDETLGALSGTFTYPFPYGYSCAGLVARSRSPEVDEGDRVFAFHPHQDLFVAGPSDVMLVDGLEPRVAVMYPLAETALQASVDADLGEDEVVVVTGLGVVGILIGAILTRGGARVIASEPAPWRRKAAGTFGVTTVAPEALEATVAEATDGEGARVVIEASGQPEVLVESLGLLRHEGTALVCSWYGTKPVALPLGADFHRRRLSIRSTQVSTIPAAQSSSWNRKRRSEVAWSILRELPVAPLATHSFPFEEAERAYGAIESGEEGLIHAALGYR